MTPVGRSQIVRYGPSSASLPVGETPGRSLAGPSQDFLERYSYRPAELLPLVAPMPSQSAEEDRPVRWPATHRPAPSKATPFDLAGQLKVNPYWQRAVEFLRAGQLDRAAQEVRLGLIFWPGRPEGHWLMALVQSADGRYADAVARLRNGLSIDPHVLSQPRGAVELLGTAAIDRLIRSADKDASAEQVLLAAWLACESGRADQAGRLLDEARDLSASAIPVAAALRSALAERTSASADRTDPVSSQPPAAGLGRPAERTAAAPSGSLTHWLASEQGYLMGLPPPPGGLGGQSQP